MCWSPKYKGHYKQRYVHLIRTHPRSQIAAHRKLWIAILIFPFAFGSSHTVWFFTIKTICINFFFFFSGNFFSHRHPPPAIHITSIIRPPTTTLFQRISTTLLMLSGRSFGGTDWRGKGVPVTPQYWRRVPKYPDRNPLSNPSTFVIHPIYWANFGAAQL